MASLLRWFVSRVSLERPERGRQAEKRDDQIGILDLPMELLQQIAGHLTTESLLNVRLSSFTLLETSRDAFGAEYLSCLHANVYDVNRLNRLSNILSHPHLARYIQTLQFFIDPVELADPKSPRHKHVPQRRDYNTSEVRARRDRKYNAELPTEALREVLERLPWTSTKVDFDLPPPFQTQYSLYHGELVLLLGEIGYRLTAESNCKPRQNLSDSTDLRKLFFCCWTFERESEIGRSSAGEARSATIRQALASLPAFHEARRPYSTCRRGRLSIYVAPDLERLSLSPAYSQNQLVQGL